MRPIKIPKMIRQFRTSKGLISYTIYDLLKEIENRPVLWLKKHIDHRNSGVVDGAWNDICLVFVPYFNELDEDEQNRICLVYKRNWKNVVCRLMESVRQQSLPNKKNYRPYHYARHMEFYLKTKNLELEKVFDKKELEELDKIELEQRADYEISRTYEPVEDIVKQLRRDLGDDADENAVSSSKRARTENLSTFKQSVHENNEYVTNENMDVDNAQQRGVEKESQFNFRNQQQQNTNKRVQQPFVGTTSKKSNNYGKILNDPDQAFFDSVKPTLRKLSDPQKLEFKINVLEILKKYQNL